MEDIEFKIIIPLESYRKIFAYVDLVNTEITGFADCEYNEEDKVFKMGEIYLLEQEASGAEVEMSEEKVSEFTLQMVNAGKTQLPRCWWHSHANMNVFFSGTDEEAIKDLKNDTFLLALVVNKERELRADITISKPFNYRWNNVPVEIDYSTSEIPEELREEVKKKVNAHKKEVQLTKFFRDKKNKFKFSKSKGGIYFAQKRIIRTLPKDNKEAEKIIWDNVLSEIYDRDLEEMVWGNMKKELIYRDPWEITRQYTLFGGKKKPTDPSKQIEHGE